MSHVINSVPTWVMISIYLILLVILGVFGDLFVFLLGTFILTLVFANGYNREHLEEH
jgi:hypothetical protein